VGPQNQEEFSVHPLIYEGETVKFYAVNRSLICAAHDEAADRELIFTCPSKEASKCPERKVQLCRSLFIKHCPAKLFIEETLDESEYTKLFSLLEMVDKKKGQIWNTQKFKDLTDTAHRGKSFLELKPTSQVRIGCFWEPGYRLYLTHGFYKQRSDWPSNELEILRNVYDDYVEVKNQLAA
jgi:hypothetical protein